MMDNKLKVGAKKTEIKLLLIVGNANDVFIYNFSKWLKTKMNNISIDVFDFFHSERQGYNNEYYDNISSVKLSLISNMKFIRSFSTPFEQSYYLRKFIKDKHYDIIHCQWLLPATILTSNLDSHCDKLYATFWGGELEKQEICHSHKLYMICLKRFLKTVSTVVNAKAFQTKLNNQFPFLKSNYHIANLGSAAIDELYNLIETEDKDKNKSKEYYSIDPQKKVVLIGYSGKSAHNHIPIIEKFKKSADYKDKIHFLAPMSRGGNDDYIKQVEEALMCSGFSYTLISGKYLSDREVAIVRHITDIALQFSTVDGFSRSIVECLCAKSVLLYGDWLDYSQYLKTYNFSAITVSSIEEGVKKCCEVVDNFEDYKLLTENNSLNGKGNFCWSKCIDDWITLYKNNNINV